MVPAQAEGEVMSNHKPGRPATPKAAETRRDTRESGKATRVEAAKPQMERKPFENGG